MHSTFGMLHNSIVLIHRHLIYQQHHHRRHHSPHLSQYLVHMLLWQSMYSHGVKQTILSSMPLGIYPHPLQKVSDKIGHLYHSLKLLECVGENIVGQYQFVKCILHLAHSELAVALDPSIVGKVNVAPEHGLDLCRPQREEARYRELRPYEPCATYLYQHSHPLSYPILYRQR